MEKITPTPYYTEWKGHPVADLRRFFTNSLLLRGDKPIVWLAGDSSLDNKAWLSADGPGGTKLPVSVPDIYTPQFRSLTPFKPDVGFWMNHYLGNRATCINGAVEASLLRERSSGTMLPHDKFVRDNIRSQDILVVCVGGNDIALSPTWCTAWNIFRLTRFASLDKVERGIAGGLRHFKRMFGKEVEKYVSTLCGSTKPAAVLVCMIYQPLEFGFFSESSWADRQLKALKYDTEPKRLQAAIKTIYSQATAQIKIPGTKVIPVPLFEVMNGKYEEDYVERVEPSATGGRKISEKFRDIIVPMLDANLPKDDARQDSTQSVDQNGKMT